MVTASFKEGQKTAITTSLQKYDYGEVLRIKGLSLPRYVAVQFAVDGMSEALPSSIGETTEDVTDVLIPNSLLRSNIKPWNYNIMAYVYIVSGSSGKTEYTITIPVKWRPKTGDDQAADDDVAAVIGSAVEKMNTATTKAENAANQASATAEEIKADREKITTNEIKIAGLKSDIIQFNKNGMGVYFPVWELGDYDINGKTDNTNRVRSKELVYLDAGTYALIAETKTTIITYYDSDFSGGANIVWLEGPGTIEFTVTVRNYIGIISEKIGENAPTKTYAIVPSYISKNFEKLSSDIEQNGTKIEETNSKVEGNASDIQACSNSIHEVKDKLTYNSGVFNAIIEGVTKNPQTNVYQGLQVGSKFELLTNDIYTYTMCVNNVEVGRTYRLKARVTSKSHFIFFIDSSGILIKKDGYNDSDTSQTLIDYCVIVPEKAAQMYVLSLSSVDILIDIYNPYTVKNRQNNLQNHAHGIYCIMQYNVGDWYEGQFREEDYSGSIPADEKIYSDYIEMHTKIFERYGADFCLINEDARSMCLNRHDDSRAFLGQWYSHLEYGLLQEQRYTNVYNTIASNISLEDVQVIHFSDTDSNTSRNLLKGYAYLNGKKVCIANTHLSANSKIGKKNCVELLNFVKDEPYLILAGDFNLSLENDEEVRAFETAGFKISHGSETFNDFTYGHGDLIVTTQNITIKSVFSDRIKCESECCKYIDHLPTIAYLEIF